MKFRVLSIVFICLLLAGGFLFANHCIRNLAALIPSLGPSYISTSNLRIDSVDFSDASYSFLSDVQLSKIEVSGFYLPQSGITRAQAFVLNAERVTLSPSLPRLQYLEVEIGSMSFRYKDVEIIFEELNLQIPRSSLSKDAFIELSRSFFLNLCLKTEISNVSEIGPVTLNLAANSVASKLKTIADESRVWRLVLPLDFVESYLAESSIGSSIAEREIYATMAFNLPSLRRAKQISIGTAFAEYPSDEAKRAIAERFLWARELSLNFGSTPAAEVLRAAGSASVEIEEAGRRGMALFDTPMSRSAALLRSGIK